MGKSKSSEKVKLSIEILNLVRLCSLNPLLHYVGRVLEALSVIFDLIKEKLLAADLLLTAILLPLLCTAGTFIVSKTFFIQRDPLLWYH